MSSRIEENLNLFNSKCAKLDMPPECYPDPQCLKKIFRQIFSFFELFMQKVDTKYAVDAIRKNLLIAHMKNPMQESKSSVLLKSSDSVPKEYKKYVKYNQLVEKMKNLKDKQHYLKQEESMQLETIETNAIKIIKAEESYKLKKAKTDILKAKSININNSIEKEENLQKRIKDVTPAKFSSSDSIDDFCSSIRDSIQVLRDFSSNADDHQSKDKFWKKIESNLKLVPNNVLFQIIIQQLNSKIEDSVLSNSSNVTKENPVKLSEKLLPQLYQHKIISGIELIAQKKQLESNKQICADHIQVFENEIESLLNSSIDYSFQLEEDDIIGDFLSVLIAKVNLEGKIKFCTENIKLMKEETEDNSSIREYDQLVEETRNIFNFIGEKIAGIQEHAAQVHQINEKVNFSKISAMRMIQSLKIEKSQQHNRILLNQTLNNTVISGKDNEVLLPRHDIEIQQFLDIPIYSFNKSLKIEKLLFLKHENIISNMIRVAGQQLDPQTLLDILEKQLKFGNRVKSLTHQVAPSKNFLIDVNFDDIEKQRCINSDEISAMFDEISKLNVAIASNLRTIDSLFRFAYENPLKKFVPKNKKYLEKSFESYEKEYMLYFKMIKN